MSQAISEKINPNRIPLEPLGLKAESTLNRISLNTSSVSPEETLYINIPKLAENVVIVPGSVSLIFDLTVAGHANNTLVNNVGSNLVSRLKVLFGGETLQDTQRYDLFQTYHDLYLTAEDREDGLKQGISSENMRKLRTNAGDKVTSDAKEVALAAVYNTKYSIPLNHPILSKHGAFYPKALPHPLTFEITLAPINDVVVYSDKTKPPTYKIANLELEYSCISSEYLAREAQSAYQVGKGFFYENVILHKTFTISRPNDSVIKEHINLPRRSMTGILCLFTESYVGGARDSENFVNPNITSININVDGMPNRLYSKGMVPLDLWESVKKRFGREGVKQKDFYADKFALWIDLRTYPDNGIHGGGMALNNTLNGVKLEMKRKVGGTGNITCLHVRGSRCVDGDHEFKLKINYVLVKKYGRITR